MRHTTVDIEKGHIYGRSDVLLSTTFEKERKIIMDKLPRYFSKVYSSPSYRCLKLASSISEKVNRDERLMEYNFGIWEGKNWNTMKDPIVEEWMKDFVNVCPPSGETLLEMRQRVLSSWKEITKEKKERDEKEKKIIITHGGVIRLILNFLEGLPLNQLFQYKIEPGEVISVQLESSNYVKMNYL